MGYICRIGIVTLTMCLGSLEDMAEQKNVTTTSDRCGLSEAAVTFRPWDEQQRFRGGYLWLLDRDRGDVQSLDSRSRAVLKQLDSGKVRSPEQAAKVAMEEKFRRAGLLASERPIVVSLITLAVGSRGFASRGDLVWIVHIEQLGGGVSQEAWINARNGAIRWMLPFEKGTAEEQ